MLLALVQAAKSLESSLRCLTTQGLRPGRAYVLSWPRLCLPTHGPPLPCNPARQISDTVYPMYKAFIEPDLKAAHLRIYNTFNPFSGFMSPTYILKSARRVSKAAVEAVMQVGPGPGPGPGGGAMLCGGLRATGPPWLAADWAVAWVCACCWLLG